MKLKEIILKNENIDEIITEIIQNAGTFCYFMSFEDSIFLKNKFLEMSEGIFLISAKGMVFIVSEKNLRTSEGFIEFDVCSIGDSRFKYKITTEDDYNDFMKYVKRLGFSEYQFKNFGATSTIDYIFNDAGENSLIYFNNDFIFDIHDEFLRIKFDNNVKIQSTENSVMYISKEWILNICYNGIITDSIIFCQRKNNTFFYSNNLTDLKNFLDNRKEENEDVYR